MCYPPKHPKNSAWPCQCLICGVEQDSLVGVPGAELPEFYQYQGGHACGDCADMLATAESEGLIIQVLR